MRALVVYESLYGNTHVIATNIAAGLRATHQVTVVPVAAATPDLIAQADLLVVGAPTHMHRMSTASSRQAARKAAARPDSGLTLDPGAGGPAVRDWLSGLAHRNQALAAAFDTRLTGNPVLTGHASRGISRLLTRHGYFVVMPAESFLVSRNNNLIDGESQRARHWGARLGSVAAFAHVPAGA